MLALPALAFTLAALWAWDFTVDDALISLRYAHNWARGLGYTFNPGAAASDGVTPLPWPFLLWPLARSFQGWALLDATKALGALGGLLSVVIGAWHLQRARQPWWALTLPVLSFPLIAWSVSGMETGLATLWVTLAASVESGPRSPQRAGLGALFAGLAATLRPELLPWALTVTLVRHAWPLRPRVLGLGLLAALGPFLLIVALRLALFGRAAPLSVLAKPSDLHHGLIYTLAAGLAAGLPLLLLARARPAQHALRWATLAHALTLIAVGGDWMPYARLWVPVLPALVLMTDFTQRRSQLVTALAALAALGFGWRAAPAGVHIGAERQRVSEQLAKLQLPTPVAALDIGFVAFAVGDGAVIDLGGLTDLEIAARGGGLSSKRIDLSLLERRGAQSLVVWGDPPRRVVEQRLLREARFGALFHEQARLPLGGDTLVIYARP